MRLAWENPKIQLYLREMGSGGREVMSECSLWQEEFGFAKCFSNLAIIDQDM